MNVEQQIISSPLRLKQQRCFRGAQRSAGGGGVSRKAKLKHNQARNLRNNLTEAEQNLWYFLRKKNLNIRFRRQQPIGDYIVDFISFDINLIIEVDGGQHAESKTDATRDQFLKDEGFKILRFWNNEVISNIDGVLSVIIKEIASHHPHPTSPLQGEELIKVPS